jgi:hypothetical protein
MRISFDLDDTLVCYGDADCEPRLPWFKRLLVEDEPLRAGAPRLARELIQRGHELWVYTTSERNPRTVWLWLLLHGIRVRRVITGTEHARRFGSRSLPTKRPHVFGIHLHIDDSDGVAMEGKQYGFRVCVVEPTASDWVERVLNAVQALEMERERK